MEKELKDLTKLTDYQDRQVILNYYEDEEFLWKRDGFMFATIKLTETCIVFTRAEHPPYTVALEDFPEHYVNTDFQNYYTLRNGSNHIDIYFP